MFDRAKYIELMRRSLQDPTDVQRFPRWRDEDILQAAAEVGEMFLFELPLDSLLVLAYPYFLYKFEWEVDKDKWLHAFISLLEKIKLIRE